MTTKKKISGKKAVTKKKTATKKPSPKKKTPTKSKAKPTVKRTVKKTTKPTIKKAIPKTIKQSHELTNTLTSEEQKLVQQHTSLKLQIELVPGSCWWSNVRSNVTKKQWDNIRNPVYAKANLLCEICGERGTKHPVECHEVWIYDDNNLTQTLGHFQSLCPLCHEVKHIGLAGVLGNGERAANRFKRINQLDEALASKIKSAVFRQWNIRSRQQWTLDIEHLRQHGLNPDELKEKYERQK